jgi:hypothetical protein
VAVAGLAAQDLAGIDPNRRNALRIQIGGAQRGSEQFPHGHDARAHAVAEFAVLGECIGDTLQFRDEGLEALAWHDTKVQREIAVLGFDGREHGTLFAGERRQQQSLELIGDSGECRVDDDRMQARRAAFTDDCGDVRPILRRGDAGAPKLEDDP